MFYYSLLLYGYGFLFKNLMLYQTLSFKLITNFGGMHVGMD
jgi:hypothetical protein